MVLTREISEAIKYSVNKAVSESIKTEIWIEEIVNKVTVAHLNSMTEEIMEEIKKNKNVAEDKVTEMQYITDNLDQAVKQNNLRIFNMKEVPNENIKEEILKMINGIISININEDDIKSCYKTGNKEHSKSRGIVLKLKTLEIKKIIYLKKKFLKGTDLVIREDLTKWRVKLLSSAIGKLGLKNVWTENGRIYTLSKNKLVSIDNVQILESLSA